MDPITISIAAANTSKVAWKVGVALLELYQTSQVVNETIKGLQAEVERVEKICKLIDTNIKVLRSVTTAQNDPDDSDNEDLFDGIEAQIASCALVILKINNQIQRVQRSRIGSLNNATRQIRLNMSQKEIDESKAQIQAGVQNLQLSLQLVNLKATYLAPRVANEALLEKIKEIQGSLQASTVDGRLHQFADEYIARGTTLYATSVASSVGDGIARMSARPAAIADWLVQIEDLRLDTTVSSSAGTMSDEIFSSASQSTHTTYTEEFPNQYSRSQRQSSTIPSTNVVDEDDNEYAIEQIQSAQAVGREAYNTADYATAEAMLRECLALIKTLPEVQRRAYDLDEMHLLLALCSFRLHESETAAEALNSALERPTESHSDLKFAAGSFLAEVYVRLGRYDLALSTCSNVYNSRRKLLGSNNDLCFDSLALLGRIFELQNMPARAQIQRSLIPIGKRDQFVEKYKDLMEAQTIEGALREPPQVLTPSSTQINTTTQPAVQEWNEKSGFYSISLAISPDGTTLACGLFKDYHARDARIELRDPRHGNVTKELIVREGSAAHCLAFNSGGQRLASGHRSLWRRHRYGGSESFIPLWICIWNVKDGTMVNKFCNMSDQKNLRSLSIAYSPQDEQLILTYQYDGHPHNRKGRFSPGAMAVDSITGNVINQVACGGCFLQGFSRDGSRFALRQENNKVVVRDVNDISRVLEEVNDIGVGAKYAPDGSLIGISADGKINVYKNGRITTQPLLTSTPTPTSPINSPSSTSTPQLHRSSTHTPSTSSVSYAPPSLSRTHSPLECKFAFLDSGILICAIKTRDSKTLQLVAPQRGLFKEFSISTSADQRPGLMIGAFMLTPDARWLFYVEHVNFVRGGTLRSFDVRKQLSRAGPTSGTGTSTGLGTAGDRGDADGLGFGSGFDLLRRASI